MSETDWRQRLEAAISKSDMSMRQVSLKADCGPGYVHSILKDGKDPSIDRLQKVGEVLGLTVSYILYGIDVSPETAEVVRLLEMHPRKRQGILAILRDEDTL